MQLIITSSALPPSQAPARIWSANKPTATSNGGDSAVNGQTLLGNYDAVPNKCNCTSNRTAKQIMKGLITMKVDGMCWCALPKVQTRLVAT